MISNYEVRKKIADNEKYYMIYYNNNIVILNITNIEYY